MSDSAWRHPPIRFDDLPAVLELLGPDAARVLRGWVLVPAGWLAPHRPAGTVMTSVVK